MPFMELSDAEEELIKVLRAEPPANGYKIYIRRERAGFSCRLVFPTAPNTDAAMLKNPKSFEDAWTMANDSRMLAAIEAIPKQMKQARKDADKLLEDVVEKSKRGRDH